MSNFATDMRKEMDSLETTLRERFKGEMPSADGRNYLGFALKSLQESRMWIGKFKGAEVGPLPEQYADKATK